MQSETTNAVPNPGSCEAREIGCICPVLDNAHGKGWLGGKKDPVTGETLFVYTVGCTVHDTGRQALSDISKGEDKRDG